MYRLVTVFGASGFVGRHVVRALAAAGYRVRAVVRKPHLANYLLTAGVPGQVQIVKGDVRFDDKVAETLEGADCCANLVGILYQRGRQNFEALHVDAAGRIAKLAKAAGVRSLAHVSAIGALPTARAHYAQTKGEGEKRVREEFAEAVILRPSLIFGPEDDFFNRFAWMAKYAPALPLIRFGKTKFQPVYVGDVAQAVVAALSDESHAGETFHLGGPKVYSFKELLRFTMRQSGQWRPLIPLPSFVAKFVAFFLQMPSAVLPIAPVLTVDQVRLLRHDNVVGQGLPDLADLGIAPKCVEEIVPEYIWRFRPKGQFDQALRAFPGEVDTGSPSANATI